jgi:beta-1,4-mannooligosaccharide/beta-1,4-mannosyl-N-acetylglucosamine phosphorylase
MQASAATASAWNINEETIRFDCDNERDRDSGSTATTRACALSTTATMSPGATAITDRPSEWPTRSTSSTFHQTRECLPALQPQRRALPTQDQRGALCHALRPSDTGHTPFGDIFYSESPDMEFWGRHRHVMARTLRAERLAVHEDRCRPDPRRDIGGLAAVLSRRAPLLQRLRLQLRSALLDLDEPWKAIYRSGPYLISPQKPYECMGDVPNVCFPCAELHDPPQAASPSTTDAPTP